ncbi:MULTISPECIES: type IV pilin protein [Acinetobacter]|uniref:Prepilin-type N-terminal cleavage/methylation domain-containing protein n=1 Tax=Acinetobacter variabilis TaxID=70346 RepID=A0A7T7WHG6_9GAMM|nr:MULTISPECIES: prepilin-type N-terminal cleavage/methylation domain-containing protein [Acinetobacter]QQN87815.1 prepilin-type N-terminal cleavage/methylation domain-containing protein [Acinetobacter variabilis]
MKLSISKQGFTLIELMIVVAVIAIIAAIAYPSYRVYIERKDLALAQKEALLIASELEKFKSKNFSYKNFSAEYLYPNNYDSDTGRLLIPVGSTVGQEKYIITLSDIDSNKPLQDTSIVGLNWVMKVERADSSPSQKKQPNNYDLLLSSNGLRCKSKTNNAFKDYDKKTQTDCKAIDSQSEAW